MPSIQAIRDRLVLRLVRGGIDGDNRVLPEAGGVISVNDCRTGEDHSVLIGIDSDRLVFPMNQILRSRMSPMHGSPNRSVRVILIVEMPNAVRFVVEHAVGVVHPVRHRRVMIDRTVRLVGWMDSRLTVRTCRDRKD